MNAKCGRCGAKHDNIEAVQACYNRPLPVRSIPPGSVIEDRATDRQVSYVESMLFKLGVDPQDYDSNEYVTDPLRLHSRSQISMLITVLQAAVRDMPAAAPPRELEDGMYMLPSREIFKVQHAVHGSGRQYAKKLRVVREAERDDEGDIILPGKIVFEYAPGIIFKLTPEYRMTMDQAAAFGALYGTCVRCSRTLTKEKSIERAMGPVCAEKM